MIDGVMKRVRQSGEVSIIATRVLYKNDKFRVWMDENGEHIFYEPNMLDRGEMIVRSPTRRCAPASCSLK